MTILRDGTPSQEVQRFLQGLSFPAKKDDVVHHLRKAGAPNGVVAMTEQLPGPTFQSLEELLERYGEPEEPLSPLPPDKRRKGRQNGQMLP